MVLARIVCLAALLALFGALASVLCIRETAGLLGDPELYADSIDDVKSSLRGSFLFLDGLLGGQGGWKSWNLAPRSSTEKEGGVIT